MPMRSTWLVAAAVLASAAAVPAASTQEPGGCVERRAVEHEETEDSGASWSPNGRRIAFHTDRNGTLEVWTLDVATCATTRLTGGEQPDWSPDGRRLVLQRWAHRQSGLWLTSSTGGGLRRLTRGVDVFPAWSPRGNLIAFDRDPGFEEKDWRELHVVQPNGRGLRKLTRRGWTISPAFSRSGVWIAFTRNNRIWRRRLDGSGARPVTAGSSFGDFDPSWSPNGRSLVFARSTFETGLQPWIVELATGQERRLVDMNASQPDWSPDGQWIVFTRHEGDHGYLSLIRPDGTGLRELTAPAR